MLINIVGFFLLFYSIVSYKKAFMLYMIYLSFCYANGMVFGQYTPLTTTIGLVLALGFSIVYLFKKRHVDRAKCCFPFLLPLCAICISLFVTCFYSLAGFTSELMRATNIVFQNVIVVWIAWNILETESDFKFIFKGITFVFLFACLYGYIEYLIGFNPILTYKNTISNSVLKEYSASFNRGYRVSSIFEHPIGTGMTLGLYSVFVANIYLVNKDKNKKISTISIVVALMCIPIIILTKMRAPLVFALIAVLPIVNIKNKRFYKIAIICVVGALLIIPIIISNSNIFLSIFSKTAQESVKGSDLTMRLKQLNAVKNVMSLSPVAGLGESFRGLLVNQDTLDALGFESVWFEQMAKHGMIGVISSGILMLYSLVVIPKKYASKEVFFVVLAYWVTYTLTSIPYFRVHLYYLYIFYFIKSSEVYKNMSKKNAWHSRKIRIR